MSSEKDFSKYHLYSSLNDDMSSRELLATNTIKNDTTHTASNDLEQVLGATTLSGDKLLNYFINDGESKLIFLAVENEAKPNKAIIFKGLEAVHYIEKNVSGVVKR